MYPWTAPTTTTALVFLVSAFISITSPFVDGATCTADEYCPNGWRVHRKPNYDPTTCDPMSTTKCGKPYQCVHAQCGLNFCCAHHRTLREWKEQNELEHEMEEYDDRSEL
ncbi:hypothetical protein NECAME_07363 [Necator americanus]|uniref:WAP domain-containing protein n=1 Tax=Necator americanus TaxID=51031 RepID=W2TQZ3_NECAM|nr:hypothetical protein NECAME_07363 [Necator americanus]ETN83541.1 hypothetical protein NECAME_07363 [Necator americanus]